MHSVGSESKQESKRAQKDVLNDNNHDDISSFFLPKK